VGEPVADAPGAVTVGEPVADAPGSVTVGIGLSLNVRFGFLPISIVPPAASIEALPGCRLTRAKAFNSLGAVPEVVGAAPGGREMSSLSPVFVAGGDGA
jgi:hypothetical protein